ncbi:MAG: S-methyl-5'-thioinosine phosphorylase [Solirubrobacterales bacterium]|nr:S-methyl-5'-thioinosine phosphorylase [Solirubrobacterales bacterium]
MLAVIGGSGLYSLDGLEVEDRRTVLTRFGETSGPVVRGSLGGRETVFLARHGEDHSVAPHRINYRANIDALREAGGDRILSIATVGGIGPGCVPGSLVVPDQMIDYTWGREQTFAEAGDPVVHTDFTEPYSPAWRAETVASLVALSIEHIDGGTYAATQGPRFESAAEVDRLRRDGCVVVGMTGMPEAVLAREAGLEYSAVCPVGNLAAGIGSGPLSADQVIEAVGPVLAAVGRLVTDLLGRATTDPR